MVSKTESSVLQHKSYKALALEWRKLGLGGSAMYYDLGKTDLQSLCLENKGYFLRLVIRNKYEGKKTIIVISKDQSTNVSLKTSTR